MDMKDNPLSSRNGMKAPDISGNEKMGEKESAGITDKNVPSTIPETSMSGDNRVQSGEAGMENGTDTGNMDMSAGENSSSLPENDYTGFDMAEDMDGMGEIGVFDEPSEVGAFDNMSEMGAFDDSQASGIPGAFDDTDLETNDAGSGVMDGGVSAMDSDEAGMAGVPLSEAETDYSSMEMAESGSVGEYAIGTENGNNMDAAAGSCGFAQSQVGEVQMAGESQTAGEHQTADGQGYQTSGTSMPGGREASGLSGMVSDVMNAESPVAGSMKAMDVSSAALQGSQGYQLSEHDGSKYARFDADIFEKPEGPHQIVAEDGKKFYEVKMEEKQSGIQTSMQKDGKVYYEKTYKEVLPIMPKLKEMKPKAVNPEKKQVSGKKPPVKGKGGLKKKGR